MFLNKNEKKIIDKFMKVTEENENKKMLLKWKDGSQIEAIFDSYIEDENDFEIEDEKYEEFWSFVFEVISVMGKPPVYITEDEYFCVSYHNFPDEIIADNKKIN